MKTIFILIMAILSLHSPSFMAQALDKDWTFDPKTSALIPKYLGLVKAMKGKAIVGDRELKKGSKIYNNDLVQTSEASFIVIEMIDLTSITLGPNSDFKVENWSYRTINDRDALFHVIKGQWRALIKSKSKKDDQLKIVTPIVSMAVRGTELLVNVSTIGKKEVTQVALLEGHIHLQGEGPELQQDLVAGDHVAIVKDEKGLEHKDRKLNSHELKSYQEFTAPEILRLLKPVSLDGVKEATNNSIDSKLDNKLNDTQSNSAEFIKKKKEIEKSLQKNIEILNMTREKNLKK